MLRGTIHVHHPQPMIFFSFFKQQIERPVIGAIIDNNNLKRRIVLSKKLRDQLPEMCLFVVRRDNDRDWQRCRIVHLQLSPLTTERYKKCNEVHELDGGDDGKGDE
jgi:hypothetical protein